MTPDAIQGVGIWQGDGAGASSSISESVLTLIKQARAALSGEPSPIAKENAEDIVRRWEESKLTGRPFFHEQQVLDPVGRTFIVQSIVVPIHLEDGAVRYVGFNLDITDRAGAVEQRDAVLSLQKFSAGEHGAGTWMFDPFTDRFEISPVGRDLLGLSQTENISYSAFVATLSSADKGKLAEAIVRARSTLKVATVELDGSRSRSLKVSLVATEHGPIVGELRDALEELRRAQQLAELSSDPILIYDRKLRVVGRNAAAESISENDTQNVDEILTRCVLSGTQASIEYPMKKERGLLEITYQNYRQ